jgi:hypothetical protein
MLLFGVVQAIGGLNALFTPPDVQPLLPYPALLSGILSIAWAMGALFLSVWLFGTRRYAWVGSAWYIVLFVVSHSLSQVIWTVSDYERQRIPFLLTTSLLVLVIPLTYLVWYYTRRGHTNGD